VETNVFDWLRRISDFLTVLIVLSVSDLPAIDLLVIDLSVTENPATDSGATIRSMFETLHLLISA